MAQYVRLVQASKANPLTAIQVGLVRTSAAAAPEMFRELDFIQVNLPSFAVFRQSQQVVGYGLDETSAVQPILLTQMPDREYLQAILARLSRPGGIPDRRLPEPMTPPEEAMLKLIMLLLRHVKASLTPQEVSVIKQLLIQAGMQPPVPSSRPPLSWSIRPGMPWREVACRHRDRG